MHDETFIIKTKIIIDYYTLGRTYLIRLFFFEIFENLAIEIHLKVLIKYI